MYVCNYHMMTGTQRAQFILCLDRSDIVSGVSSDRAAVNVAGLMSVFRRMRAVTHSDTKRTIIHRPTVGFVATSTYNVWSQGV